MKKNQDEIFVQIPSYRDTQLIYTIESLLNNAHDSTRLKISICWQHDKSETLTKEILNSANINIIDIDYRESKGANWARSVAQKNWDNETYTLLIDSHIRFSKKWDIKLINMLIELQNNGISKPILTGYPPSFDPKSFPKNKSNYPLKMYVEGYYFNLLTKFNGQPIPYFKWIKSPIKAHFISLGFLFTIGNFNREIPFDPNIYFYGDEITTGLRAYCHGYDFFHPHRVIAWHLYDRTTRTPHWENHNNWHILDAKSCQRIKRIFKGVEYKNFPLGKTRSISDYEEFIGYKLIENE
ncbi:GlcNAc-transferase family protein [Nostoc sp. MG11]|uniref:GlcNAc-transferase family protein n=1 Tax=Nostoc sp. MG11 TaxID=2721166 RepID=UPI001866EB1B|nr:GlcNAc-transferase family protein [Nostoc sp. MG11]